MGKKYIKTTLRLTEEENKILVKNAKEKEISVNEYIKNKIFEVSIVENKKDKQDSQDSLIANYDDTLILVLKEQLATKDNQILELSKLLDQQQKLLLQEQNNTKLLLKKSEIEKKWWKFWK